MTNGSGSELIRNQCEWCHFWLSMGSVSSYDGIRELAPSKFAQGFVEMRGVVAPHGQAGERHAFVAMAADPSISVSASAIVISGLGKGAV